jgi:thiamine pyrophosphokinase
MGALHRSPRIRFKGTRRDGRIAVLALHGASSDSLRDADAWARSNAAGVLRVAVDGGVHSWRNLRRGCDLFVGDADSGDPPPNTESVIYDRDKSFSDLAGALGVVHRRGIRAACIAGVIGGRLDHEWANLLELAGQAARFRGLLAPTSRGWIAATAVGAVVETRPGKTFSLLAPAGPAKVDLTGARWSLRGTRLRPGSRGLSNVTGKRLRLSVESGVAFLVFPEH